MAIDEFCWKFFETSGDLKAYLNYTGFKSHYKPVNRKDEK
jgi:hypothetical protein